MYTRILAALASAALISAASAQPTLELVENDLSGVVDGPDAALIQSGAIRSFDVWTELEPNDNWTVFELDVMVSEYAQGQGVRIWHATDERYDANDPNEFGPANRNLSVPMLPRLGTNSREFDTFFVGPDNEAALVVDHPIIKAERVVSTPSDMYFLSYAQARWPVTFADFHPHAGGTIHDVRLSFHQGHLHLTTEPVGEPAVIIYMRQYSHEYNSDNYFEATFTLYATGQPRPPCDITGDGVADSVDLSTLLAHFGKRHTALYTEGDVNADGKVNSTDLSILLTTIYGP